jgi:Undecaprenyl-phosphate galactose phosphotransferase WbaP
MQTLELGSVDAPTQLLAAERHGLDSSFAASQREAAWPSRDLAQVVLTAVPLVVADLLAVVGSFLVAWQAATALWPTAALDKAALDTAALFVGFAAAVCVANLAVGLYPGIGVSAISEVRQASLSAAYIGTIFLTVSVLEGHRPISQPIQFIIVTTCCLLLVGLPLGRTMARAVFSRYAWWGQPVLIVGGRVPAANIYSFLSRNPRLGLRPLGVVGDWHGTDRHAVDHRATPPYLLGPMSRAAALVREFQSPWLIVAMPGQPRDEVRNLVGSLARYGSHRTVISELNGSASLWRRASACLDWPGERRRAARPRPVGRMVKRTLDVVLTVVGGLLLLPLLLIIAAFIKWQSPGPVLFRQERVGLNGRRFLCWKFRTMIVNGDRALDEYLAACPKRREVWDRDHKLADDPRVTPIGRLLRKTSLDELPQLWNVLRGQMSLVGPRPILDSEIADFGSSFQDFCSVLPGMTGLWQVSGRNQTTYAEHIELDAFYARHWSLWLDLYILILTVRVVLFRHGAC